MPCVYELRTFIANCGERDLAEHFFYKGGGWPPSRHRCACCLLYLRSARRALLVDSRNATCGVDVDGEMARPNSDIFKVPTSPHPAARWACHTHARVRRTATRSPYFYALQHKRVSRFAGPCVPPLKPTLPVSPCSAPAALKPRTWPVPHTAPTASGACGRGAAAVQCVKWGTVTLYPPKSPPCAPASASLHRMCVVPNVGVALCRKNHQKTSRHLLGPTKTSLPPKILFSSRFRAQPPRATPSLVQPARSPAHPCPRHRHSPRPRASAPGFPTQLACGPPVDPPCLAPSTPPPPLTTALPGLPHSSCFIVCGRPATRPRLKNRCSRAGRPRRALAAAPLSHTLAHFFVGDPSAPHAAPPTLSRERAPQVDGATVG